MPRVPGYQPNQVGPVQITDARFRPANNNGGALGALGEGLQQIGGAAADYAEAQDRINAQFDDTQARKESAALQAQYTALTTNFSALQGGNAVEQRAGIETQIDEMAKASIARAANPRQKRMLEERIAELQISARSLVGRHAQNEGITERRATLKGQEAGFADSAASADDPAISHSYVTQGLGAVRARLDFEGIRDPTARAMAEREFTSTVHSSKISRWFQSPDPDVDMITAYADAHRDEMTLKDYVGVLNDLREPLQNRQADSDFVRATSGGDVPAPTAPGVISATRMHAITAQSESGNRERDGQGRLITSSAGAQGRMQVMPETARDPGHGIRPWDGRSDEDRSRVGRELLDALMSKYGDPAKAWAAYNWGEGRVDKAVAAHGANWLSKAPAETKAYVQKNMAALGADGHSVEQPQRWDKDAAYTQIDALADKEGWTFERRERAKRRADNVISRDEQLLDRREREADRQAGEIVLGLGERFTSINQIPRNLREQMSAADLAQYQAAATRNSQPKEPPANGEVQMTLNQMRFLEPDKYMGLNLGQYVGQMTRAELDTHLAQQAKMRSDKGGWSPRSGIVTAVSYGKRIGGMDLEKEDETAIMQIMEAEANALYAKTQKPLTEQEYTALFQSATRNVTTHRQIFGYNVSSSETPRYRLTEGQIPSATRQRIEAQFKREMGREPTDEEVLRLYRVQTRR